MPALLLQIFNVYADLVIILFVAYYFLKLHAKEKELEKKEGKVDTDYHQVVDDALTKERKILEDAANEADQIISGATYINRETRENIHQALQVMVTDIQKEAADIAHNFMISYQNSLKQLANQSTTDFKNVAKDLEDDLQKQIKESRETLNQSLTDFQTVAKQLEGELQSQIKDFHEKLLPDLKKELEAYKQTRMEQTEQVVKHVIQKVSQDVLNKTISLDDHQNLIIESLEKAKKEGVFE
jgi:vacuolar-type H+-ATPase subunit H